MAELPLLTLGFGRERAALPEVRRYGGDDRGEERDASGDRDGDDRDGVRVTHSRNVPTGDRSRGRPSRAGVVDRSR